MVDKSPTDTKFGRPDDTGHEFLTMISCTSSTSRRKLNASRRRALVQVENFGMHLNVDGTIVFGVYVDAVIDRKDDDISVTTSPPLVDAPDSRRS